MIKSNCKFLTSFDYTFLQTHSIFQPGQRRREKGAGSREVVEGEAAEEKGNKNKACQREEEV